MSTCPTCGGDGEELWICPTCDAGTWIDPDTGKPDVCPACLGAASGLRTCSTCGGDGEIDD